jgi:hypothetical protein
VKVKHGDREVHFELARDVTLQQLRDRLSQRGELGLGPDMGGLCVAAARGRSGNMA